MNNEITSFNIRGERCTGTTYLQKLIETNLNIPYVPHGGWKHGFYNLSTLLHEPCDKQLTVIIYRNVFDWLRSFYLKPHQLENSWSGIWKKAERPTFSEFIRREVKQFHDSGEEIDEERHPLYLTRPKNLLEMRRWKIEHFNNLSNVLPHTYYVRYEDLVADPQKIIKEINQKCNNIDYTFTPWENYKTNTEKTYSRRRYFYVSDDDTRFIYNNVDWNLEVQLGYSVINIADTSYNCLTTSSFF